MPGPLSSIKKIWRFECLPEYAEPEETTLDIGGHIHRFSMMETVPYYNFRILHGDDVVFTGRMTNIEITAGTDGMTVLDFERFLRKVQEDAGA